MATSRARPGPHGEVELGIEEALVGPALEDAEDRGGDRGSGTAGALDDRRRVPRRPCADQLVEQVLARLEVPVEARPVDAEALRQREHPDLVDSLVAQRVERGIEPLGAAHLAVTCCGRGCNHLYTSVQMIILPLNDQRARATTARTPRCIVRAVRAAPFGRHRVRRHPVVERQRRVRSRAGRPRGRRRVVVRRRARLHTGQRDARRSRFTRAHVRERPRPPRPQCVHRHRPARRPPAVSGLLRQQHQLHGRPGTISGTCSVVGSGRVGTG